jgi:hypothetical protein
MDCKQPRFAGLFIEISLIWSRGGQARVMGLIMVRLKEAVVMTTSTHEIPFGGIVGICINAPGPMFLL